MPGGVADLVKGVLPVGLKRNVEINGGTCGWGAQSRDGLPREHHLHVAPTL